MAATSKKPAAPKAPAKKAAASRAKTGSFKPAKSRIVPGLYQGRLLIAPDFFEPHETPPGLAKLMPALPPSLSDPRVLLTEAGEQQWLDQLLDEAAAQQQREKGYQALAEAARRPVASKRPRKAA